MIFKICLEILRFLTPSFEFRSNYTSQIANLHSFSAFQTAVALATYEARQKGDKTPKITEDHFSQIVEMSSAFKKYMHSTLLGDDAEVAYRSRLRNDTFKLVPVSMSNRDA